MIPKLFRWRVSFHTLALLGVEGFLLIYLDPRLILTPGLMAGGDIPTHFPLAALLREQVQNGGSLFSWVSGNFAGFPAFVHYFPLPFLLVVFLSFLIPIETAFRIVVVLPILALPPAVSSCLKNLGLPRETQGFGVAATLLFLFMREQTMWGGNIASTLAGEFAYGIGLVLSVILTGRLFRDIARQRRLAGNAVLEALVALSNGYPLLQMGWGSLFFMRRRRYWRHLLLLHATAVGLLGFWLLPFLRQIPWNTSFAVAWVIRHWTEVIPRPFVPVMLGIPLGWIAARCAVGVDGKGRALGKDHGAEPYLWWQVAAAATGFAVAPWLGVVDARFLPFAQLYLLLLGVLGWTRALDAVRRPKLYASLVTLGVLAWAGLGTGSIGPWVQWSFSGMETKPLWPAFSQVNAYLAGTANHGRVYYEHAPRNHDIGTERAFELLPHFAGRSTIEGLYLQSSPTAPFVFYLQSELSRTPSCPFPNYVYSGFNPQRAAAHLRLFNVSEFVAVTEQTIDALDQSPEYMRTFTAPPYVVYRIPSAGKGYAVPLRWQPHRVSFDGWKQNQFRWFRQSSLEVPLVVVPPSGTGEYWRTLPEWQTDQGAPPTLPAALPDTREMVVSCRLTGDRMSIDTSRPLHPLWIKVSYHPDWHVVEGQGELYLASPSFMLLVPSTPRVVIEFTPRGGVYALGWLATFLTGLALLATWVLCPHPLPDRTATSAPGSLGPPFAEPEICPGISVPTSFWVVAVLLLAALVVTRGERDPVLMYYRTQQAYSKAFAPASNGGDRAGMKPQRHRRELIAEARSAFSDCIERFPLSSVVDYCYQHLVGSYLEERQWSRAKILLTRYLASYPEARLGAEAWYQLGLCSLYLDQPEEASRALWKVILQHPGSPFAAHAAVSLIQTASPEEFFDRAQSLVEEGRWDAAHPLLHALSLQEGSPLRSEVVRLLIHAEFRRSRWERAARLASKWLADFPDDEAEVWYVYGRSLAALGRFDEAATALQRTLDLDPDPGRESELQVLLDSVRFLAKSSPPRVPPERTGKEGRP